RQWFVNRGTTQEGIYRDQLAWCNSLGYRMPRVRDLTNAKNYNNLGATPSSSRNSYMRHIGAGFFTEWGYMYFYTDAGFVTSFYWTSDWTNVALDRDQFDASSAFGNVYSTTPFNIRAGLCTAP
ncbi:MAG: hypothetical protein J6572_09235, partial [Gilliamella sp.]|nr:hypothetical protein [Gilliamella sp.]